MIKFIANGKNGGQVIGFGLSEENVKRMKSGDPVYLHLDELGIEGIDVTIFYGQTEKTIVDDLRKQGLIV